MTKTYKTEYPKILAVVARRLGMTVAAIEVASLEVEGTEKQHELLAECRPEGWVNLD